MSHSASPSPSPCHDDSCAVAAFDDELIDDGNIDWDWNKNDSGCSVDSDRALQLSEVSCSTDVVQAIAAPSSTDSDVLSRIHATIQSLIAGEKIVQQTKADTLTLLADTLANYDSMVDDVIRCIGDTRVRVKDEIRGVFECALKRLDGQIDELAVSIGQLEGLAVTHTAVTDTECASGRHVVNSNLDRFQGLLKPFGASACTVTVKLPHMNPESVETLLKCDVQLKEAKSVEGVHVATLKIRDCQDNIGLAVDDDATLMAVSNFGTNTVTVYQLPSGKKLAAFGGRGCRKGQFDGACGLCFTVDGTLLVADCEMKCIQDVTTTGEFKRTIGKDELGGCPVGVAANEDVIVVSQWNTDNQHIAVFDYHSGSFIRGFGESGSAPGQLKGNSGLRITSDGRHIIVAEWDNKRLSIYTLTGQFVRTIGDTAHEASGTLTDVCITRNGDIIGVGPEKHEIVVFSADCNSVLRRFGCEGTADGQFKHPRAVSCAAGRLYVLGHGSTRVQVFE